jgi:peptidoglycan DL-endopeptidase CwlO
MPSSPVGASVRAPRTTLSLGARSTTVRIATIVILTAALVMGGLLGSGPRASASSGSTSSASSDSQTQREAHPKAAEFRERAERVLRVARNQHGDPYQYGAAGPGRFDCSGLVMFVFRKALGKSLPHYAQGQWHQSSHIRRSQLRPGDLVFQMSDGYAYHVGIYAGNGYMWDAPHSGTRVHKHKMYHSHWRYGRLIHTFR